MARSLRDEEQGPIFDGSWRDLYRAPRPAPKPPLRWGRYHPACWAFLALCAGVFLLTLWMLMFPAWPVG